MSLINSSMNNNVADESLKHEYHQQQSVLTMQKSVTITVTPQRSNSLDYLNFEEKRQLIASSLSLSDILQVGPAVAQAAKDASTVIGNGQRKYKRISISNVMTTSRHRRRFVDGTSDFSFSRSLARFHSFIQLVAIFSPPSCDILLNAIDFLFVCDST
jgi:hypothetical protein